MKKATQEAAKEARLEEITQRDRIGVSLGFHGDNPEVQDVMFLHRFYDGQGTWDETDDRVQLWKSDESPLQLCRGGNSF